MSISKIEEINKEENEYVVTYRDNGNNAYTWEQSTTIVKAKSAKEAVEKIRTTAYKWELIDIKKI